MKFLCIPCDEQMKLRSVTGPDRGSVSLIYACPTCGYGIAMMTNAHETQVVSSLGVQIGPEGSATAGASKCPVTGMLRELEAGGSVVSASAAAMLPWSREASARLEAIPHLVRPMARESIERFARENGYETVTEHVLDRARSHFGL